MKQYPLQEEIIEMFKDKQEALSFLSKYVLYIHAVDDCIDEGIQHVKNTTQLAFEVFNHSYWLKWRQSFALVERLIHNAYFDSLKWEKSGEKWKERDAKVLNQRGYDMLFAIILIEFGEEKLSEFSYKFREFSHLNQGHAEL